MTPTDSKSPYTRPQKPAKPTFTEARTPHGSYL